MKIDQSIIKAVTNLSNLQYDQNTTDSNRAIGAFCANIMMPLITARSNSNAYKLAKKSLIERGRNAAKQTTAESHDTR